MHVRRRTCRRAKPPTAPTPPSPTTQNQCSPAMKNSAAQTSEISIVWPKSGCRISGTMVSGRSRSASSVAAARRGAPARLPRRPRRRGSTKAGLTNSDGWMPKIQRREPLTSCAEQQRGDDQRHADRRRASSAARRTWRGDRNEVATSSAADGISNSDLPVDEVEGRQAEPLGDRRARRQRHARCRAPSGRRSAPSSQRSTVHHQSATGPTFGARDHAALLAWTACTQERSATSARNAVAARSRNSANWS